MSDIDLSNLLYLLAVGAFVYWMMKRGSCHGCHGKRHGGGPDAYASSEKRPHDLESGVARDPYGLR